MNLLKQQTICKQLWMITTFYYSSYKYEEKPVQPVHVTPHDLCQI